MSRGRVRVILLGSEHGGDDEAALQLAPLLFDDPQDARRLELIEAGRPGPGLVDLLDTELPVLLLDVVRSGAAPGTVHRLDLAALPDVSLAKEQLSSHGFGPAEALKLARVLGRALPRGVFVGIEGARFEPGAVMSTAVRAAMPAFAQTARDAIATLRQDQQDQCHA